MANHWWALFSVDNNYDQPPNNLVAFFSTVKPSIEELAKAIGYSFPNDLDDITLAIVKIWAGEEVRISETDYRLQQIGYGIMPEYKREA
jgi:hypothetical protein